MTFRFLATAIAEVKLIEPNMFRDERGFFLETFRENIFLEQGLPPFVQENHSRSCKGVLRGLHFQKKPKEQGKLVRCGRGAIYDVAVDIRPNSATFGRFVGAELTDENGHMLYIPEGFAHGFCTLSAVADVFYKATNYYSKEHDRAIRFDDPQIGINWPLKEPILSDKDRLAPLLREVDLE